MLDTLKIVRLVYLRDSTEWLLGIHAIIWGFQIYSPWSTTYANVAAFRWLYANFPDWSIGGISTILGLSMLWAASRHDQVGRTASAMFLMIFWLSISSALFWGNPTGTGWITYLLLCLVSFRLYVVVGSE